MRGSFVAGILGAGSLVGAHGQKAVGSEPAIAAYGASCLTAKHYVDSLTHETEARGELDG